MAGYILDVDKDGQYITTPLAFIAQRIHRLSQAKDFMNFTAVLQDHGAIQTGRDPTSTTKNPEMPHRMRS